MEKEYIATYKRMTELLQRHGFNMKKNFGQNFLIDLNILKKIVKVAGVDEQTIAVEIGAGVGSLTQVLATYAQRVQCFEIDYKLQPLLTETLVDFPNVEVLFEDFLKADLTKWYQTLAIKPEETLKVVANLPYYITTPILEKIIEWYVEKSPQLTSATVMMQKEVARRLVAQPGTKEYGSLSIFIQLFTKPELAFTVSKNVFVPAPNVDSAIVSLQFKQCEYFKTYAEATQFLQFVRLCFATRRKTLYNNLKATFTKDEILNALQKVQQNEKVRAEALCIEDFLVLFTTLYLK